MPAQRAPYLDSEHIAFITGPVSINVAACGPGGFPALMRAVGCRVSQDRCSLAIVLSATAGADVIAGIRQSGAVAVVFSEPPTHRTLQVKGRDARVLPAEPSDATLAEHYRDGLTAALAALGYAEDMVRAFLTYPPEDLVTIRFEPSAAFSQTPGPHAGEALRVGT